MKEKYEVVLDTPILVVVKIEGKEIIVHNYGELIFKEREDEGEMRNIAEEIYRVRK